MITGNFIDDNIYVFRGFVRSAKGVITEFDAQNAGLGTNPNRSIHLGKSWDSSNSATA